MFDEKNLWVLISGFGENTWRRGSGDDGGTVKVTRCTSGNFLLIKAVNGDITVVFHGVRLETRTILLNLRTVSTWSTRIIYYLLKRLVVSVLTHTNGRVCSITKKKKRHKITIGISDQKMQKINSNIKYVWWSGKICNQD